MADTNPNLEPGAPVVIDDDGRVTAHGPKAWIWCTDESTGARIDVPAGRLPREGLTPVDGYEVNFGRFGRDPKPATDLAGGAPAAKSRSRRSGSASTEESGQ